jgi:hypothetical protein
MAREKSSLQIHNLDEIEMAELLDLAVENASARRSAAEIGISPEEAEQVNGGIAVSTTVKSPAIPPIVVGLIYEPYGGPLM